MSRDRLSRREVFRTASRCRQHFGRFLSDQRGLLWRGGLATTALVLLELLRPWPLKIVIDHVILPRGDRPAFLSGFTTDTLLSLCVGATLLLPLIAGILHSVAQVSLAQAGRKVTTRVRRRVCEHLTLLPLSYHHSARTGDLLVRVMGDVSMVRDILFSGWIALVQRLLVIAATLVLMLVLAPQLGAVALLPLPLLFWTYQRAGGRMKEAVSKQRRKEGDAASLAAELLSKIRCIKAFGAERRSARIFGGLARSGERAGVKATRIAAAANLRSEAVTGAGLALVLALGAMQVQDGTLSPGSLLLLLSYTRALYKPLRKLNRDAVRLAKAAACADRLFEVLELPAEDGEGTREAPRFEGRISFEGVHFSYGPDAEILRDLSFEVPAGTLCLLDGPNGSGKSTSLGLLLRLFTPAEGAVCVDGHDARDFALESWRSRFAYVPQEDLLFSGTLAENLRFANPEASDEALAQAIETVGLSPFVASLPNGLETEIGEGGDQLSGGQRRLLSLARAGLREADILLLDEPFEGLAPGMRELVAEAIPRLANGRTTLVVSHGSHDELAADLRLRFGLGSCQELWS